MCCTRIQINVQICWYFSHGWGSTSCLIKKAGKVCQSVHVRRMNLEKGRQGAHCMENGFPQSLSCKKAAVPRLVHLASVSFCIILEHFID